MSVKIVKNVAKTKPSPMMALTGLNMIVDAYKDYKKTVEIETTKRAYIKADKEKFIAKIDAQKELIINYFEYMFSERKDNFKKLFETLDKGISASNNTLIEQALSSIITIAKDSPLKGIKQLVSDFKNDNIDEIEI